MPIPSTAAAIAPRLVLIVNLPSTWNEVAASPLRKDQWPPRLAGPRMIACWARSAGASGDPAVSRYARDAARTRGHARILRTVAVEFGKRTKSKRDVHAFGHEVFAPVCHHQVDPQRRMPVHEVRKPGDHLAHGKVGSKTDTQQSAQLSRSARSVFRLVELGQDGLDARQEIQAGVGQRYGARGPDEQRDADFALQRRDRPGRGRLRNVEVTPGRGKTSLAGDPSEQPQREQAVAHSVGG